FLGTGSGGLVARSATTSDDKKFEFHRISGVPDQVYSLLAEDKALWVGASSGLFKLSSANSLSKISGPWPEKSAIKSFGLFKGNLVIGTGNGEIYLLENNLKWSKMFSFADYSQVKTLSGGLSK
ncbi:hypothetical protein HYY75_00525, partial [bacterium]|nr:hypothetical protein [bacterium]